MKKYLTLFLTCIPLIISAQSKVVEPIQGITVSLKEDQSKSVCIQNAYSLTFPPGKIKIGKKGPFVLYAKQEKGRNKKKQLSIYHINRKLAPSEMIKSYIQMAKKAGQDRYEIYRNENYIIVIFVSQEVEEGEAKAFFESFSKQTH